MTTVWGNIPAWVSAVGTVSAVSLALAQVARDRRLRRQDELIDQAKLVSAWLGTGATESPGCRIDLSNRSDEPVYEAVIWVVTVQGAGPKTGEECVRASSPLATYSVIPPGQWRALALPGFDWGMSRAPGVEIAFTDRSGRHWIRRASGALAEIPVAAPDHYGLGRPLSLGMPEAPDARP